MAAHANGSEHDAKDECCSDTGCGDCGCMQVVAAQAHPPSPPHSRLATSRWANGRHLVAAGVPSRLDRPPIA